MCRGEQHFFKHATAYSHVNNIITRRYKKILLEVYYKTETEVTN